MLLIIDFDLIEWQALCSNVDSQFYTLSEIWVRDYTRSACNQIFTADC